MRSRDNRLVRHLAVAVIVKLAVLAALWWVVARVGSVSVDAETVSAHIVPPAQPAPPTETQP